tara:strand:+ start:86 stop:1270 length:1185 start_codon:yes stop_codon:yes gene_type:complete
MKTKTITHNRLYHPSHFKRVVLDNLSITGKEISHKNSLTCTFDWIHQSFKVTPDNGSSAGYSFNRGWLGSYPETTGYLIPTLIEYAQYKDEQEWSQLALKAADWLIDIQYSEGGWQGLQVDKQCDQRIFNTAMIIDGLIAAYKFSNNQKYLESAFKAVRWSISKLDENGYYSENNIVDGGAFDTLVNACLLMAIQYMPIDEKEKNSAIVTKSLDAHLNLQNPNGTFKRCSFDNDNKCLLHHLGYTLDGLMISYAILKDEKYYRSAKKTADKLLSKFEVKLELPALTNSDWTTHFDLGDTKASLCLTGYSQIAIVFQKIYRKENDARFLNAALKIIDIVASISNYRSNNKGMSNGVPGSFPINGIYHQYEFVNWAAKYHAESILLSFNQEIAKIR